MEVTLLCPPAANHGPLSRPRHWPLFALSTAAALRERGHGVRLIDAHLDRPDPQATAARVADSRPDAVLVFSADYNRRIPDAVLAAHLDAIAAAAPDAGRLLVARNSLAEARRQRAAQPAVKAVTVGEPEAAACRFVGAPAAAGPGLLFHLGETVAPAGPEATPAVPAWDLSPPGRYGLSPHQSRGEQVFPVLASRGCPYGCFFCEVRSQAAWQPRPAGDVARELRLLRDQWGARSFFLADPIFALQRQPTLDLLAQIAPLGLRWSAMTRTDRVDPPLLRAMADAGCWSLIFGIETLNPKAQAAMHKHLDPATVGPAIAAAQAVGIEVIASAMIGLPGDDPQGVRVTVEALQRMGPDFAQFFEVRVPNEHAVPGGRLDPSPPGPWEFDGDWYLGEGFAGPDEVRRLREQAYRRFYLRPAYVAARLRRCREQPRAELLRGLRGARIALSRAAGRS